MSDLTASEVLAIEQAHGKPFSQLFLHDEIIRGITDETRMRQAEKASAQQRIAKADERIAMLDRLRTRRIGQLHDEWKAAQ
jgi:hypothetical protein